MIRKVLVVAGLIPALVLTCAQRRRSVERAPVVPIHYRELYEALDAGLDKWMAYLQTRQPVAGHDVTWGAEVLPANVNRGSALLAPPALAGVEVYLDSLAAMGVEGASISIGYPILDPSFPRSDEYLTFYRRVAEAVRERGMKLHVETGVAFVNTPFSDIEFDFSALTLADYIAAKRVMAQRILEHMRPDFLGLGGEPDTEAGLTGLAQLNDPVVFASAIGQVIEGLDRGATVIGAGVGTWSPLAFAERLSSVEGLDAITIHIYPIWRSPIENATLIPAIARARGKRVTLDEAWLYKAATAEASDVAANEKVFRRDPFEFWAPLDNKFLSVIARLAAVEEIDYVSPFWTTYFFAMIPWDVESEALSYGALVQKVNEKAVENIVAGRLSPVGRHYRSLIGPGGGG